MGKYEEALEYCDKAVLLEPNYVYALSYKGKILYNLGRYEGALKYYDEVLRIDPTNHRATYYKNNAIAKISKNKKFSFITRLKK
jgi:tetratricopeptide (TPR) repeat protein